MTMHPQSRLTAAYLATEQDGPDPRRLEKMARGFRPDPKLERILSLPDDKREALLAKDASLRVTLGHYASAKAANESLKVSN